MNSNKTLNSIKYEKKNLKWKKAELESDELQNWNIKTKPKERQEEFMEENEGKITKKKSTKWRKSEVENRISLT